jgi:hypothetical protein
MAVTAEVWNKAHDYHRLMQEAHTLYIHGAGIIKGLRVTANDPVNARLIHVEQGVAVDTFGRTILYPEGSAIDLGNAVGMLYIILYTPGERELPASDSADGDGDPHYLQTNYRVELVAALPDRPHVELARLLRTDASQPVRNALDEEQPGPQELDLRFRRHIGQTALPPMALGLVALERTIPPQHWQGWLNLARELRHTGAQNIWAQSNVVLDQRLASYPMLCVVGQRGSGLGQTEQHHLREYLLSGGLIYYESCHSEFRSGDNQADKAFMDFVTWLGGQVAEVPTSHPLYRSPHLFLQLPQSYEERTPAPLQVVTGIGPGVAIISKNDYGCVWSGSRRSGALARAEVREAFEWGRNLITFALHHRARQN